MNCAPPARTVMRLLTRGVLLLLLAGAAACAPATGPEVRTETRQTQSGSQYTVFYPDKLSVQVSCRRPEAEGGPVQLCVAAAYTDLQTNTPLDLLVCNGTVLEPAAKVGFLDGVLTIVGDSVRISRIAKGQSPPEAEVARVRAAGGTLLLQELLVFAGQNQRAAGGSLFQRRALVELANRRLAVVESVADGLTMQQFADDLLALGARNALYLDMGDWDEGWYKANGRVIRLGHRQTETARQSNWLVFAR